MSGNAVQVLYVDDNEIQRYAMSRLLRDAGFVVTEAENGATALERVSHLAPTLVVLDVHLPDVSGFEVCRLIKENPKTAQTLIVQVSAQYVRTEDRARGLEGGADGYITQPVDPQEFIALVRSILRLRQGELERLLLLERERKARTAAESERSRLEFLAEASRMLASSLDYSKTLEQVAGLAVAHFADWFVVDLLEENGKPKRSIAVGQELDGALAAEVLRYSPRLDDDRGAGRVLRSGEPECGYEVEPRALEPSSREHHRLATKMGVSSYLIVPMLAGERCLGALTMAYSSSGRRYDDVDRKMIEDLGRRVGMAVENARLFQAARKATRIRDELLAVVSHDLRNPLGVIALSTVLLGADGPITDAKRLKHVGAITRATEQMERLIQDLLDVASIEVGQLSVVPEPILVAPLLREAVESFEGAARGKSVSLVFEEPDASLEAYCDRSRVLQIIGNLIANAIKFTPRGGRVEVRARAQAGATRVLIADTGPGLAPESLNNLFDRYWQATPDQRGRGLGLYIARGLVTAQRGEIGVESVPGHGATFWFTVPSSPPEASLES